VYLCALRASVVKRTLGGCLFQHRVYPHTDERTKTCADGAPRYHAAKEIISCVLRGAAARSPATATQ